mgnify:CR=1 FL=1
MRDNEKRRTSYLIYTFNLMWYLIGFISAIDVYYAIKFSRTLLIMEENPFGKYLIKIAGGDVSLFIGCKVAGTVIVLGVLQNAFLLGKEKTKLNVHRVTFGVFTFQVWLFLYMNDYFLGGL